MAVNNPDKKFCNIGPRWQNRSNLPQYFNLRIRRVKITMVIYHSIVLQHWHLEAWRAAWFSWEVKKVGM
jgi:hypothetical protein